MTGALGAALEGARLVDDLGFEVPGDYGSVVEEYRALRHGAGIVDRSVRGVVEASGPDGGSFLQSLVAQDLDPIGDGQGAHSLLLQPNGKLDVDFRLLRVGDAYWLDCEPGLGARLASSLARYRIRVDAQIDDRSDEWGCLAVKGADSGAAVARAVGIEVPRGQHEHVGWEGLRVARADWPGVPGIDLVGPRPALEEAWSAMTGQGVRPAGIEALEAVRVEAGVPRQGLDIDERTIPQEARLDETAVSFEKGCFLGQELVCRIRDRGRVTRVLRGLVCSGDADVPRGAEVVRGGEPVGRVTSAARSWELGATVGLGTVRAEVEPGGEVSLRWDGGDAAAVVRALPLIA